VSDLWNNGWIGTFLVAAFIFVVASMAWKDVRKSSKNHYPRR
jgi:hypothetical protein